MKVPIPTVHGKPQLSSSDSILTDFLEHCTTVTHVLAIGLTLFIFALCFQDAEFNYRTWHSLLYTFGWYLLVNEGILYISKENVLSKRMNQRWRSHVHWIVIMVGVAMAIAGFVLRYNHKSSHFTSTHGKSGLASGILGVIACISGIPNLFSAKLRAKIPPVWNKLFHGVIGFASVAVGTYALITGFATGWFTGKASEGTRITCMVITIVITCWVLLKPLINIYTRTMSLVR